MALDTTALKAELQRNRDADASDEDAARFLFHGIREGEG